MEDIPGAEDDILKLRERDKILDLRCPVFSPFAQADRPHLRQAAGRVLKPELDRLDAGY